MANKLTKAKLKKHLAHLEQKELIEEIAKLFTKFKEVKQYYQMEYGSEEDRKALLNTYKKKIEKEFYTRGGVPRYPKAASLRKLITEFKKISTFKYDLIELNLYRVELAIKFSNDFGGMDEPYYNSTLNAYYDAISMIGTEQLHQEFKDIALKLVNDTYSTGWGFYDGMINVYTQVYEEFE